MPATSCGCVSSLRPAGCPTTHTGWSRPPRPAEAATRRGKVDDKNICAQCWDERLQLWLGMNGRHNLQVWVGCVTVF